MQMIDLLAIIAIAIFALTMVLRDVAKETLVFFQHGMLGRPEIVVSSFRIVIVEITFFLEELAEVEVDGDELTAIPAPEEELERCVAWDSRNGINSDGLLGEVIALPCVAIGDRVV